MSKFRTALFASCVLHSLVVHAAGPTAGVWPSEEAVRGTTLTVTNWTGNGAEAVLVTNLLDTVDLLSWDATEAVNERIAALCGTCITAKFYRFTRDNLMSIKSWIGDNAERFVDTTKISGSGTFSDYISSSSVWTWVEDGYGTSRWMLLQPRALPRLSKDRLIELCGLPYMPIVETNTSDHVYQHYGWQAGVYTSYWAPAGVAVIVTNYTRDWFEFTPWRALSGHALVGSTQALEVVGTAGPPPIWFTNNLVADGFTTLDYGFKNIPAIFSALVWTAQGGNFTNTTICERTSSENLGFNQYPGCQSREEYIYFGYTICNTTNYVYDCEPCVWPPSFENNPSACLGSTSTCEYTAGPVGAFSVTLYDFSLHAESVRSWWSTYFDDGDCSATFWSDITSYSVSFGQTVAGVTSRVFTTACHSNTTADVTPYLIMIGSDGPAWSEAPEIQNASNTVLSEYFSLDYSESPGLNSFVSRTYQYTTTNYPDSDHPWYGHISAHVGYNEETEWHYQKTVGGVITNEFLFKWSFNYWGG